MPEGALPDDLVGSSGPEAPAHGTTHVAHAVRSGRPAHLADADARPPVSAAQVESPPATAPQVALAHPDGIPRDANGVPLPPPATDTGPDDDLPQEGPAADDEAVVDEEAAAADHALKFFHDANVAFNTPDRMNRDDTADVVLVLSRKESIAALKAAIGPDIAGGREGKAIRTASRMEAKLTGLGFDIVPTTNAVQAVGSEDRVTWAWQVRPKAPGPQTLTLTLTAKLDKHGVADKTLPPFTKTIQVEVTPTQRVGDFVGRSWQWLWGAILVPLAAFGRNWYMARKRSKDNVA
jgi:hypothetical protein